MSQDFELKDAAGKIWPLDFLTTYWSHLLAFILPFLLVFLGYLLRGSKEMLVSALSGILSSCLERICNHVGLLPPKVRKDPIDYEKNLRDRLSVIYQSRIAVLLPNRVKLVKEIATSLGTYRASKRVRGVWKASEALMRLAIDWPEDWQTVDATKIKKLDKCINKFAESLDDTRRVSKVASAPDFYRLKLYHTDVSNNFDFRRVCNIKVECPNNSYGEEKDVFRSTLPLHDITPEPNKRNDAKFYSGEYFEWKEDELTRSDVLIKLVTLPDDLTRKAREDLVRNLNVRAKFTPQNHPPLLHYAVGATKVLLVFKGTNSDDKSDGFYSDWPSEIIKALLKRDGSTNQARFERSIIVSGRGSSKTVYKAFDSEEKVDVAWCEIRMKDPNDKSATEKEEQEIVLLALLEHDHIISYVHYWRDEEQNKHILITELMSGTLRQYVENRPTMRLSEIAKYSLQILSGLSYMHAFKPSIIHRDLKCENIFIDSSSGKVKIGDFGVSHVLEGTHAETLTGTPAFMAPEIYDTAYDEGVDVYSLGMCVLEMATGTIPYGECKNMVQIDKKASKGIPPDSLATVTDDTVRDFIQRCLLPRDTRPSVKDLATHPLMLGDRLEVQADGTFIIVTLDLPIAGQPREVVFQYDETEGRLEDLARQCLAELHLDEADAHGITAESLAERIRAVRQCRPLQITNDSIIAIRDLLTTEKVEGVVAVDSETLSYDPRKLCWDDPVCNKADCSCIHLSRPEDRNKAGIAPITPANALVIWFWAIHENAFWENNRKKYVIGAKVCFNTPEAQCQVTECFHYETDERRKHWSPDVDAIIRDKNLRDTADDRLMLLERLHAHLAEFCQHNGLVAPPFVCAAAQADEPAVA
ncbi:Protein kinase domain [Carpediemonas membranifera]|uniref:Protein kinase domain n=1 Tax=Carpediemonas membranifera TaxID=201153 RepID=A0A8J6B0F6_9EUKA|nr:Protein kinase domain [Carpediemonas membranifera]|eukprot:KAG9391594.1 Protein kinase domain [Carpediemonas membranifera]